MSDLWSDFRLWHGSQAELLEAVERIVKGGYVPTECRISVPPERTFVRYRSKGIVSDPDGERFGFRHLLQCLLARKLVARHWTIAQIGQLIPRLDENALLEDLLYQEPDIDQLGVMESARNLSEEVAEQVELDDSGTSAPDSLPMLAARLLALGAVTQYWLVLEGEVVGQRDIPAPLRRAMALLGRLRLREGSEDHCANVHEVLARCTRPLDAPEWGIEAFRDLGFPFAPVVLIDPDHRCPTLDCVELAKGGGEAGILEELSFNRLRETSAQFGERRHEIYARLREFMCRNPVIDGAILSDFLRSWHITRAEPFMNECYRPMDGRDLIAGRLHLCRACGVPLGASPLRDQGRCTVRQCRRYHLDTPLGEGRSDVDGLRILRPHLLAFWFGPGLDELRVYDAAREHGLPASLYPASDACDVAIDGDRIGIDIKSYASPLLLAEVLGRSLGGLARYRTRIIAVSDAVVTGHADYLELVKHRLGRRARGLLSMSVSGLLRWLKTEAGGPSQEAERAGPQA